MFVAVALHNLQRIRHLLLAVNGIVTGNLDVIGAFFGAVIAGKNFLHRLIGFAAFFSLTVADQNFFAVFNGINLKLKTFRRQFQQFLISLGGFFLFLFFCPALGIGQLFQLVQFFFIFGEVKHFFFFIALGSPQRN